MRRIRCGWPVTGTRRDDDGDNGDDDGDCDDAGDNDGDETMTMVTLFTCLLLLVRALLFIDVTDVATDVIGVAKYVTDVA